MSQFSVDRRLPSGIGPPKLQTVAGSPGGNFKEKLRKI